MAIVTSSPTRSADALINYVLNQKPGVEGERWVMASGLGGVMVSTAKQQFQDIRIRHGKDQYAMVKDPETGDLVRTSRFVQAYHVVQSFGLEELNPEEPDSWERAQELGRALAKDRFPGRQVLVVTQIDGKTGCVHNHIVINSIDTKTGRSLDSSIVMHARLAEQHDRVLEEHGFEQRGDLQQALAEARDRRDRGEPSGLRTQASRSSAEEREFQKHMMWEADCAIADELGASRPAEPFSVSDLKYRIMLAKDDLQAVDWDSYVEAGQRHGVKIALRGKKGEITYGMMREQPDGSLAEPSSSDTRRATGLGEKFRMQEVNFALERNAEKATALALWAQQEDERLRDLEFEERAPIEVLEPEPAAVAQPEVAAVVEEPVVEQPLSTRDALMERLKGVSAEAGKQTGSSAHLEAMQERSRQRADALEHEALKPTVEVETSSASAPAEPAAGASVMAAEQEQVDTVVVKEASATASALERSPSEQPYVSALANTRMKSERSQKIVDAVAAWEPGAVAALERGERLDESMIPDGIGPKFLESQGPGLHPAVRAQLQARELKKDQVRNLYTQINAIRERRAELGQPANESQWKLWREVETERIREETRVSRRARLQSELADGVYEPNTSANTAEVAGQKKALSDVTAQTEQRKDAYLTKLYARNPELKPDSLRSRLIVNRNEEKEHASRGAER